MSEALKIPATIDGVRSALDEIVREGARTMLKAAPETAVAEFVAKLRQLAQSVDHALVEQMR